MKRRLQGLWIVITDDRKKAGVLGSLLLILLAFGVKTLVMGSRPGGASAAIGRSGESAVTAVGQNAVSRAIASLGNGSSRGVITLAASPRLSRDLFAFDEGYFPPPPQPVSSSPSAQTDPGGPPSRALGQSAIDERAENAEERQARLEARVRKEADALRLRSVVLGTNPIAVIEVPGKRQRRVVPLGREIEGFRLEEVAGNSVVLEMDSVRVRLSLFRIEK